MVNPNELTIGELGFATCELTNPKVYNAIDWIQRFMGAWSKLESNPQRLDWRGFWLWGPIVHAEHKHKDPEKVAKQLFGKAGKYADYLYPPLLQRITPTLQ